MSSRKQASCRSSRRNDRRAERSFFSFVVIGTTSHLVICQKHTTPRWHSSPSRELTFYLSTRHTRRSAHPNGCTPKSRENVHVSRNLQNRAEKVLTESPTGSLETSAVINTCTKARTPPRAAQDAQTAKRPFCGEFAARNRPNDALKTSSGTMQPDFLLAIRRMQPDAGTHAESSPDAAAASTFCLHCRRA